MNRFHAPRAPALATAISHISLHIIIYMLIGS